MKKFFSRMASLWFAWKIEREIYMKLFPHLEGEKDCGYQFRNDVEIACETDALDVRAALAEIERNISAMPKAYGESFRFVFRRDAFRFLMAYRDLAGQRIRPPMPDSRTIPRRA
jgi:hypothetical protein